MEMSILGPRSVPQRHFARQDTLGKIPKIENLKGQQVPLPIGQTNVCLDFPEHLGLPTRNDEKEAQWVSNELRKWPWAPKTH